MYDREEDQEVSDEALEQSVRVSILRYLDASGDLARLEQAGLQYRECLLAMDRNRNEAPPSFTHTAQLDLPHIAEISCHAGSMVIEKPLVFQQMFRDVVHCALIALCSLATVTADQVQVQLRVESLPGEVGLRTDGRRRADPTLRRLLLLQGVALAVTSPTKYTRSAVFRCPTLICPGAAGVRVWGPTASRRRCRFCSGVAEETTRGRDVGEHVFAILARPDALRGDARGDGGGEGDVSHPMLVRFNDDLAQPNLIRLGCRYDVVILTNGYGPSEAWGVRPWVDGALRRVSRGLRSAPLPGSIQGFWLQASADTESPWAFAVSLASQVGGGKYPAHAFLHLRLGVLLSLASQGLDHPPVALLAVGGDPAGQALLCRGLRLADRGLCVTSIADFSRLPAAPSLPQHQGKAGSKAGPGSSGAWLCAGPLVLAEGGVCFLGCWDKWNRTAAAASVIAALESGKAVLESRDLAGTQLPGAGPSVPLKCAVWTYWSPGNASKTSNALTLRTLLNTLGAPVLADCSCSDEVEDVADHLLLKARREQVPPCVLESEMKEFLSLVNAQPVALTEEASRLIQDYFVASRRVRPNCLPVTAIGTIAAMAEALARISLRIEGTWADVVLVVWMYEMALTALFGPCLISPLPDICGLPLEAQNLIYQMDSRLNSMKTWLENFTRSILLSSLGVECGDRWR